MNAQAFRHIYDYHFSENRKLREAAEALTADQFTRRTGYSHGSLREQLVHLMSVDEAWFSDLRGTAPPADSDPSELVSRAEISQYWERVEQEMRAYLAQLQDEMLLEKPFSEGEDKDLVLWQVLLHVVNHGTDHRAQALRLLHDMGVKTGYQDYIFYAYDHALGA